MSATATVGLLAPLPAQDGQSSGVEALLQKGAELLSGEPLTLQWYGIKYTGEAYEKQPTYAVFDTFVAEEGRQAHLTGDIAKALVANAPSLLTPEWSIQQLTVLSSKVVKGDVTVGIRLLLQAKPEKVDEVRELLQVTAVPLVGGEPLTLQWYAIQLEGTNTFGVVDFFADEAGRNAHMTGKVAAALFSRVDELFAAPPDLVKVDVVASRVL